MEDTDNVSETTLGAQMCVVLNELLFYERVLIEDVF